MLDRVKALGDQHEQAELRRLSREHPGRVRHLPTPSNTPHDLAAAMTTTLETLSPGAEVVSRATVFDGGFVGPRRLPRAHPGRLAGHDTVLARHATVSALLQVGAYAALLLDAGAPVAPIVRLVLGDGATRDDPLGEVLPVYRSRRARLDGILADHRADEAPAVWGDERWLACGSCATCVAEVEAARDLLARRADATAHPSTAARGRGAHHRRPGIEHRAGGHRQGAVARPVAGPARCSSQ